MSVRKKASASQCGQQGDFETQVVAAAKHDPEAFGRLYDHYVQPLYRYLYSRIGSVQEAEDVTAQTFLAAFEGFDRYRHDGHFAAWLFTIARRKMADHFRHQQKQVPPGQIEPDRIGSDLLQHVIMAERVEALAQLIKNLPEDQQELIRLRYIAELKFQEMAVLVGRNEDAVKKTLYRLLSKLQGQMEERDE